MTTGLFPNPLAGIAATRQRQTKSRLIFGLPLLAAAVALTLLTGCEALPAAAQSVTQRGETSPAASDDVLTLKEGDVLKISFPSVPNMDTQQQIRPDGRLSLPIIGEIVVAGKSTDALAKELVELYSTKIVSKEVMVTLVSSSFSVYVTGAVLRPGKIIADRRISAFDAIMESGGFDKAKADLTAVVVVRQENGQSRKFSLNLQKILEGVQVPPFYLKPFDTVYVPEKFSWF